VSIAWEETKSWFSSPSAPSIPRGSQLLDSNAAFATDRPATDKKVLRFIVIAASLCCARAMASCFHFILLRRRRREARPIWKCALHQSDRRLPVNELFRPVCEIDPQLKSKQGGASNFSFIYEEHNTSLLTLKCLLLPIVLRLMVCASIIYVGFMLCSWVVLGPYHHKFLKYAALVGVVVWKSDCDITWVALLRSCTALCSQHIWMLCWWPDLFDCCTSIPVCAWSS